MCEWHMFYKRANLTKSAGFIEESNNMKNLPADNINHGLNKKKQVRVKRIQNTKIKWNIYCKKVYLWQLSDVILVNSLKIQGFERKYGYR